MNIKVRGVVACVSSLIILALVSFAMTAGAQTPGKSLKDQVVGHWQLVSVSIGGNDPYGDKPQVSMFLDAVGHYSVIVLGGGEANTIAYFGTYTINDADSAMTLHIDGSSRPNADGRDLKRIVTFSGGALITRHSAIDRPKRHRQADVEAILGLFQSVYFGARFARIRCSVRRCMLRRRAVSETLRPHSS